MNGYAFTAELIKAIAGTIAAFAWPGAIVIIFWFFRKKLIELLPLVILKYKDFQISFGLDKAEEEAKRIPVPIGAETVEPSGEEKSASEALAKVAPRAAIMRARADVEEAVNKFAEVVGVSGGKAPYYAIVKGLQRNEVIDQNTVNLLNDLRNIGNAAAHNINEPTEEDALRYQQLAYRLIRQFNIASGAARMPPPGPIPPGHP